MGFTVLTHHDAFLAVMKHFKASPNPDLFPFHGLTCIRLTECQYLGFEPSPRCKNCGYDFSFSGDDLPGLQIVSEEPAAEMAPDLELNMVGQRAATAAKPS